MIGRFLVSAALAGTILTGVSSLSYAQMSPSAPTAQKAAAMTTNPAPHSKLRKQVKMTKPAAAPDRPTSKMVRKSDSIADQLNACQLRAESERPSCIDRAIHQ